MYRKSAKNVAWGPEPQRLQVHATTMSLWGATLGGYRMSLDVIFLYKILWYICRVDDALFSIHSSAKYIF